METASGLYAYEVEELSLWCVSVCANATVEQQQQIQENALHYY